MYFWYFECRFFRSHDIVRKVPIILRFSNFWMVISLKFGLQFFWNFLCWFVSSWLSCVQNLGEFYNVIVENGCIFDILNVDFSNRMISFKKFPLFFDFRIFGWWYLRNPDYNFSEIFCVGSYHHDWVVCKIWANSIMW